eukprot:s2924_g6.t1
MSSKNLSAFELQMRVDPYVLCCFKRELPIDCAMPATGYSLAELCAGCSRQPGQSKCPFPQESLDMLCGRMTPSKMTAYSSFLKMPETQRLLAKVPQEVLCCLDDWEEQLCTSLVDRSMYKSLRTGQSSSSQLELFLICSLPGVKRFT